MGENNFKSNLDLHNILFQNIFSLNTTILKNICKCKAEITVKQDIYNISSNITKSDNRTTVAPK